MADAPQATALEGVKSFFDRTIGCFEEDDATFTPQEGLYTVAQHIAHTAQVVEWFLEGAFRPQGMSTDFETMDKDVRRVESIEDARTWWNDAMAEAVATVSEAAPESWDESIRGAIMAGQPRRAVIDGISDHCAHHRGALAVYARLCGREPLMPYT